MAYNNLHNEFLDIEPKQTNYLPWLVTVVVIGGFLTLSWYAYDVYTTHDEIIDAPIIVADNTPTKMKPEDPGGMQVPNLDKDIYNNIAPKAPVESPEKEVLLESPEKPLTDLEQHIAKSEDDIDAVEEDSGVHNKKLISSVDEALKQAEDLMQQNQKVIKLIEKEARTTSREAEEMEEFEATKPTTVPVNQVASAVKHGAEDNTQKVVQPITKKTEAIKEKKAKELKLTKAEDAERKLAKHNKKKTAVVGNVKYKIQVASVRSEGQAAKEWQRLKQKFPQILGGYKYTLQKKNLGDKGIFYRIHAGGFKDYNQAYSLCKKLNQQKQGCLVVKVQ